jgi:hypothetical protein
MLLADLRLSELPTSALLALKSALLEELQQRKKRGFVDYRLRQHQDYLALGYEPILPEKTSQTQSCVAIPLKARTPERGYSIRYLPNLLRQNWYHLFPTADDTQKRCYVYAHVDPRKGRTTLAPLGVTLPGAPFYIGKGAGQRAYDLKRNDGHRKILTAIRAAGFPDELIVHILTKPITELQALTLEAKLIYFFGSIYEHAERPGCLINLADHIRPNFVGYMPDMQHMPDHDSLRMQFAVPRKPPKSTEKGAPYA